MVDRTLDWREELGRWLKPFLDRLGHKARRQMCPLYVSGLIGPGDRKSIQPMAKRLALGECDQLHHFIAAGVWDAGPLETELLVQADRLVGGSDAVLVIDDTAIPKKGTHSVGVAAQYASALGKTANCQTLVSLTLARGEVPVMLALRLFLPESWTSERARLERAGVPAEYRTARTKPEMALAEIDRVIAAGVRFGCVLADAGYGSARRSAKGSRLANLPGRSAFRGTSRSTLPMCRWSGRLPGAAGPVSGTSQTFYRYRPKTCWPMPNGTPSVGVPARKESSRRVLLRSACESPTDHRSGSGTRGNSISRRGGLARRRTQGVGREKILSRQPAGEGRPAHLGGNDQGAMDLRAGPSATERRTRSRPL